MQSIPENNNVIPSEDLDRIILAYLRVPRPSIHNHPGAFAHDILNRAYTEWCLEHPDSQHNINFATGLREFIDKETHHELFRNSYSWNQEARRFEGLTSEQYEKTRGKVLDALVKWALDYFSLYSSSIMMEKNIRTSLAGYIPR